MKSIWRVVAIVLVVAVVLGAVCAGVGILTGADTERITAVLENKVAEKYNIDAEAFIHEWIPEAAQTVGDALR